MRTVEVPVWLAVTVTLGVALIGAGGAICAQLVAAWRQRKRENVKWQRDRVSESVRMTHEHASQWRDVKIKRYGSFLVKLRAVESIIFEMQRTSGADFERWYSTLREQMESFSEDVAEIELICSTRVREFMRSDASRRKIISLYMPPNSSGFPESGDARDAATLKLKQLQKSAREYRNDFLTAARDELAVDAPALPDQN